jgi:tRNA A-37 threonylcarbamoyl transferase component Bud32
MRSHVTAGTILVGFRVDRLIGEGATGEVYLAEDATHGNRVALKVLAPELAHDDRYRERFLRESSLAASLDHPHIVPIVAAGEEDGLLYLAMAYVEGSDLRELLRREGALKPERALELVGQVAEAIDAAHAAGLVHRDVKPGNILVTAKPEGERVYVCDFGLARHVSSVSSLTGDRGFVGTIDYVAPEQIKGSSINSRTDVYSLGCVLFECLTGERPFERESELSVVFAHLNEPPPCLSDLRPGLPQALDAVISTALAKSPDDRYQTCSELVAAARGALQGEAVARRRTGRRIWLLVAAALVVVTAASIGAVLAIGTGGTDPPQNGSPEITQASMAGASLSHMPDYYKNLLGGWRASVLADSGLPSLAFQQLQMAVYFPAEEEPAHIITTWNKDNKTAEGIGPCSTLDEMHAAYGDRVQPSWSGTLPNGEVWQWVVGNNLVFATQDRRTISAVALYKGEPDNTHSESPQAYAGYVAADETACISP